MLVERFCEFVRIDSESGNEGRFLAHLKGVLEGELGARGELDSYGNLICKVPAKGSSAAPLLLAAHADTVRPGVGIEPVVEEGIIYSKGETILGADDKAGIVEILEAVKGAARHPPLEIVITREEEVGFLGAKNLDYTKLEAKRGLLLDSDVLNVVVIGGPTHFFIDVEIVGKAAHAGMEPEKGVSAIRTAALAITRFREGRIDAETTANVGVFRGGEIRNGVPERAELKAECRSLNHEKAVRLAEEIRAAFLKAGEETGAKVKVQVQEACRAFRLPEDAPIVELSEDAIRRAELSPSTKVITGGTDASIYNQHGIETAVLGIGAKNEHSKEEHIAIADMKKAVEVLRYALELAA